MNVIGLISGTSSDGVDAALVRIQSKGTHCNIKLIAFDSYPYPKVLQRRIIELAAGVPKPVSELCHLNFYLGERFAEAATRIADKGKTPLEKIALIGSHGQTVHHLPTPKREGQWSVRSTLQIGEPSVIAERTGVTTIADFRCRDLAAGGEGAPLTPYLHAQLFGHLKHSRIVLNIGGISNITYLKAGADLRQTLAFDTGPGNMLIDGLVQHLTGKTMDRQGKMARAGDIHPKLLAELMRHPFIRKPPPKSTGREMFGAPFIERIVRRGEALKINRNGLIATVTAFTIHTIADAIERFILNRGETLTEVIVGGGGARNLALMEMLGARLSPVPVFDFEAIGFHSRAIEAMAFAFLAYETAHHRHGNIPSVTGASHSVVLGKIVPGDDR